MVSRKFNPFFKWTMLVLLFPLFSSALTLKGVGKIVKLEKNKDGIMISTKCKNCDAEKAIAGLNADKVNELLKKEPDARVSPGSRLCGGLGALVWVLEDGKKMEWSICEFKDKSAVLTDDLGGLVNKLTQPSVKK